MRGYLKRRGYYKAMQVQLTEDQKGFIQEAIQTGRFACEEDALQEALSLWEVREL